MVGLRLGAQGRLDVAVPRLVAALLHPPVDVRGVVPIREGSGERAPVGWRGRRIGSSPPAPKAPPEPAPAEGNEFAHAWDAVRLNVRWTLSERAGGCGGI